MIYRVLTALVLAPLAVFATLQLPTIGFAVVFAAILLVGLYEWSRLIKRTLPQFLGAAAVMLALMLLCFSYPVALYLVSILGAVFWAVQVFRLSFVSDYPPTESAMALVTPVAVLLFAWSGLVFLHYLPPFGPLMVIALLLTVWTADTLALFVGKAWGYRKLAPKISPGKTVEGVIGGAVAAIFIATAFALLFLPLSQMQLIVWSVLAFFLSLISVVGDLYESALKRRAGVKDSGVLLPGHGGLLDRIDGLLAAIPVFVAVWWWVS